MHVIIKTAALPEHSVSISNSSADQVRMNFNPSSLPNVDAVKALAAALISLCDEIAAVGGPGREVAIAKTNVQQASMWAVAAATAHLGK